MLGGWCCWPAGLDAGAGPPETGKIFAAAPSRSDGANAAPAKWQDGLNACLGQRGLKSKFPADPSRFQNARPSLRSASQAPMGETSSGFSIERMRSWRHALGNNIALDCSGQSSPRCSQACTPGTIEDPCPLEGDGWTHILGKPDEHGCRLEVADGVVKSRLTFSGDRLTGDAPGAEYPVAHTAARREPAAMSGRAAVRPCAALQRGTLG